jgi:large subunit ribosomal protein L34
MSRTYQPSKIKRKRKFGFLSRKRKASQILKARRRKGRKRLSA